MNDLERLAQFRSLGADISPEKEALILSKPGAFEGMVRQKVEDYGFDEAEAVKESASDVEMCDYGMRNGVLWCYGTVGVSFWWRESTNEWVCDEDELP